LPWLHRRSKQPNAQQKHLFIVTVSQPSKPTRPPELIVAPAAGQPAETAVEPEADHRPRRPLTASAPWLVAGCYLLGALYLTWRLWADPTGRMQTGDYHDVNQMAWYLRYAATAVQHGRLPALVTSALGAPQGVNLMWNTPLLLPGVLLTPVTLLAGPQVSLDLVLTLGLAGSAASLLWVLRRWGASLTAAAVGGAVYGFSPAVVNSGIGHYNFVFAVLPPLIVHTVLRILTGRGGAATNGLWLGWLVAAQVFIGTELLTDTALTCLVLMVVMAVSRPRAAIHRVRGVAAGLGTAAGVVLLMCDYPFWVQLFGPLAQHPAPAGSWNGNLGFFVDAAGNLLFHTSASAAVGARYPLSLAEYLSYLGWPLIIVLAAAAVWFWRDFRVRTAAVTCAVAELLSQGGGNLPIGSHHLPGWLLPFHYLQRLPVISELLPDRFAILADGMAAAVLAFSIDRARSAMPLVRERNARVIPVAVAVLAVLPLIPLPYQTTSVSPVPAGYQAAFAWLRLAPDAPVLVVPVPDEAHDQAKAMRWQADTGEPGELIGGYFFTPAPANRQPVFYDTAGDIVPADGILYQLWTGQPVGPLAMSQVRAQMAYWRPAAIVAVTRPGSPLAVFLTALLGRRAHHFGAVLAWRL
jgi:hypothetical protein